jgi:UDP-glucose 4-epimerase
MDWRVFYRGRRVLVFGGAGFLGSHLAEQLVKLAAEVVVIDAFVPGSGARRENLQQIAPAIELIEDNYGAVHRWAARLQPDSVIFHCAAFNTHSWCNEHPEEDARWNYMPNCALAAFLRQLPFPVRLLYASSRTVYGLTARRSLSEHDRVAPADVYSLHCWASEQLLLHYAGGQHTVAVLRLPHLYGPRQRLEGQEIGFVGQVLRAALRGEPYELYAQGMVSRDLLYVTDAVEVFLRLGACSVSGVFNVPGAYVRARTLVHVLETLTGWRAYRFVDIPAPFFPRLSGKRLQQVLGWLPQTSLWEGMRMTVAALQGM